MQSRIRCRKISPYLRIRCFVSIIQSTDRRIGRVKLLACYSFRTDSTQSRVRQSAHFAAAHCYSSYSYFTGRQSCCRQFIITVYRQTAIIQTAAAHCKTRILYCGCAHRQLAVFQRCSCRTADRCFIRCYTAAADLGIGFDTGSRRTCRITFDTCRIGSANAVSTDAVNSIFQLAHIHAAHFIVIVGAFFQCYAIEAVIGYRSTIKYAGAADTCHRNCHAVISTGIGQVTAGVDSNTVNAGNSCHNPRRSKANAAQSRRRTGNIRHPRQVIAGSIEFCSLCFQSCSSAAQSIIGVVQSAHFRIIGSLCHFCIDIILQSRICCRKISPYLRIRCFVSSIQSTDRRIGRVQLLACYSFRTDSTQSRVRQSAHFAAAHCYSSYSYFTGRQSCCRQFIITVYRQTAIIQTAAAHCKTRILYCGCAHRQLAVFQRCSCRTADRCFIRCYTAAADTGICFQCSSTAAAADACRFVLQCLCPALQNSICRFISSIDITYLFHQTLTAVTDRRFQVGSIFDQAFTAVADCCF